MATRLEKHLRLDDAPAWMQRAAAVYTGSDPALVHLRGIPMGIAAVEGLIPAEQRDAVAVTDPSGRTVYPWRHVALVELGEDGEVEDVSL